jgi:hypothetical protein
VQKANTQQLFTDVELIIDDWKLALFVALSL